MEFRDDTKQFTIPSHEMNEQRWQFDEFRNRIQELLCDMPKVEDHDVDIDV